MAAWTLRAYWATCRVRTVLGEEHLDALLEGGEPFIPCMWHRRQLVIASFLLKRCRGTVDLGFLVSPSRDGELGAMVLHHLGARAVRGSATRTGAQAMRELFLSVKQDRVSPVMTPDGSTGPIFEFKPGPVMLSQLARAPMLPISIAARGAFELKSWDRFVVPRPFTKLAIAIGEPRRASTARHLQSTSTLQAEMKTALDELAVQAAKAVGTDRIDGELG